ncbi:MAG: hypothetical protein MUE56_08475 [Ignavibacteria bacterium]|nr:hypothetical protein [Ignavibacteria bacterium]
MKTLNKIIATSIMMFIFTIVSAQNDSVKSYSGFEFDLTAYKTKKKLIASTNQIVNYKDTLEYFNVSSILLLKDSVRFHDYGSEIKLNLSEVDNLSFQTKSYSWLGVLIGISSGCIIGGLLGNAIVPPSGWFDAGGGLAGALLGMLTGGIIGEVAAPSGHDDYYIKGKNNDDRRIEMKSILDSAKTKYKSEL